MAHDEYTRRALHILDTMRERGELKPHAVERLRRDMLAGKDAYPYYSAARRPFVWSEGHRFTASAYNDAIELWRVATVGFYYHDKDGVSWATWSGPPVASDVCGDVIQHGYRTPDTASASARSDTREALHLAHMGGWGASGIQG